MLNSVRAVGYWFCRRLAVVVAFPFSFTFRPVNETPLIVEAAANGLVLYTPLDSMYSDVEISMAWSTKSGLGKSPAANWSNWSELFSSATCGVALVPVAVTGLGSLASLVFMLDAHPPPETPDSA